MEEMKRRGTVAARSRRRAKSHRLLVHEMTSTHRIMPFCSSAFEKAVDLLRTNMSNDATVLSAAGYQAGSTCRLPMSRPREIIR